MKCKIQDIRQEKIFIDDLYFQYIPDEFFREVYLGPEEEMMSLANSPHYRFLSLYQEIGKDIWQCYEETDYVKLMKFWGRSDKYNRNKVRKFIKTYNDIKKNGLKKKINVLESPMYRQFFSKGYEIYHGHHRASICKALEKRSLVCTVSRLKNRQ